MARRRKLLKVRILPEWLDELMRGRVKGAKRYLGNDCWQQINVEESRLNELRDAYSWRGGGSY